MQIYGDFCANSAHLETVTRLFDKNGFFMDVQTAPMFRVPSIMTEFPSLVAAESTRHGGVSKPPYHSLNLGKSTDDNPQDVQENRRRFCAALGFSPNEMAWSKQVHGDSVQIVTNPGGFDGADALITKERGILLSVSVADCTPILIYDAKQQVTAAIHAGWRGTVANIVAKTMALMGEHFGSRGVDCYAYIGTCIDECSFEVGAEVGACFSPLFKQYDSDRGKYFVDLKAANRAQLLEMGVPSNQVQTSRYSTVLHPTDYYSHRLEKGVTGRMLAVIGMR